MARKKRESSAKVHKNILPVIDLSEDSSSAPSNPANITGETPERNLLNDDDNTLSDLNDYSNNNHFNNDNDEDNDNIGHFNNKRKDKNTEKEKDAHKKIRKFFIYLSTFFQTNHIITLIFDLQ